MPACGNVGAGAYSGASAGLPSRADFAKSFNPIGEHVNSSPFPSVPSIPSFESSRTAGPLRNGKAFEDNIAKDDCENCFSPVLTITGNGRVNSNGIEVGDFRRPGLGGGQRFRQPKQFSTTTPAAPLPSYGASTPDYYDDGAGYNDYDDGYNYPVPSSPLPLPVPTSTTPAPPSYNPSTSGNLALYHSL